MIVLELTESVVSGSVFKNVLSVFYIDSFVLNLILCELLKSNELLFSNSLSSYKWLIAWVVYAEDVSKNLVRFLLELD